VVVRNVAENGDRRAGMRVEQARRRLIALRLTVSDVACTEQHRLARPSVVAAARRKRGATGHGDKGGGQARSGTRAGGRAQ
jgi:hypothetical protein